MRSAFLLAALLYSTLALAAPVYTGEVIHVAGGATDQCKALLIVTVFTETGVMFYQNVIVELRHTSSFPFSPGYPSAVILLKLHHPPRCSFFYALQYAGI